MKRAEKSFWKLVLFTVFMLYPSVSRFVTSLFVCEKIEDHYYLQQDFSLHCYDEGWFKILPVAIVMIVIYPLGIPCLFFFFLWQSRGRLKEPDVRAKIGFLFEAYQYDTWWFEIVDMTNKLTLTSLVVFFPETARMPMAMAFAWGYMCIVFYWKPYLRRDDDALLLLSENEIMLLIMCAYILVDSGLQQLPYTTDVAMSAVLITLNILMVSLALYLAIINIRGMLQDRARAKKEKEERDESKKLGSDEEKKPAWLNPLFDVTKPASASVTGADDDGDGLGLRVNPLSAAAAASSQPGSPANVEMSTAASPSSRKKLTELMEDDD